MKLNAILSGILCILLNGIATATHANDTMLLDDTAPLRTYIVQGGSVVLHDQKVIVSRGHNSGPFDPMSTDRQALGLHRLSQLPPEDWWTADFNDTYWPRYGSNELTGWLGAYGAPAGRFGSPDIRLWAIHLRTAFGIQDPARVTDLKLSLEFIGGAIVYVNGKEVGRSHIPAGQSGITALAEPYSPEAYTTADGTVLPVFRSNDRRLTPEIMERFQKRVRQMTINIPAAALVKGRNVLAIELRHAPFATGTGKAMWSHVAFRGLSLTSATGNGVVAYADALKGTRVWSADIEEQITDQPAEKPFVEDAQVFGAAAEPQRSGPVIGTQVGNPFDPVRPVRILAPRNGVGMGQAVVTDLAGLKGVKAALSPMQGPGGATLPSSAIEILYGAMTPAVHYCDGIWPAPPAQARTVPVVLQVRAPKNQAPGWYVGQLQIAANGKTFAVPAQVFVTGHVLPDPTKFTSELSFIQSPEQVAEHYKVKPWSAQHWKLLEKSFALMGQVGNDVVYVPVLARVGAYRDPMIRFVQQGDRLVPEFSVLETYLNLYAKHAGMPKAISLYVWDESCVTRAANVYEGRQISSRAQKAKSSLNVLAVNPATGETREVTAPEIGDAGAEQFYKPLIEGVRALLAKRGWPERLIVLGTGHDTRPSVEDAELMKKWVPYARWHGVSHWSGDPGSMAYNRTSTDADPKIKARAEGRFISANGQEIGLREDPFIGRGWGEKGSESLEQKLTQSKEYIRLGGLRRNAKDNCPPFYCQIPPIQTGGEWGRIGLDFWDQTRSAPTEKSTMWDILEAVSTPGPDGAAATMKYEMIRQGVQLQETRYDIVRGYLKLPEDQRGSYRDLIDEFGDRDLEFLSQSDLQFNWPGYVARQYAAAGKLNGQPDNGAWDRPPQ